MSNRREAADIQEIAKMAVAHLVDAPQPLLAAGRAVARRKPEEGGELAPARKRAHVLNRRNDRRGGDRADAGDGHQAPRLLVGLHGDCDLLVDLADRLVERVDLANERGERRAHAIGDHDLAVVVEAVGKEALELISMLRALRRDDADPRVKPGDATRKALSSDVRWPASNSRARWRISSAWLSIERTGTNRWPGRIAASQIAAASAASFLFLRTTGSSPVAGSRLHSAGGISLTSCPSPISARAQ